MILDGTKIGWYHDRVRAWERGEKIAPITVDMALTTSCNLKCKFCYASLQHNKKYKITREHMTSFLNDCAEMGVKGVSLVSDGESSISDAFEHTIIHGHSVGLAMAVGSNALLVTPGMQKRILPKLTYFRVNISAGERLAYNDIMGAHGNMYSRVVDNIRSMVELKRLGKHSCTIGMQMVLMPEFIGQVLPLSRLALDLGVDYLIIKHCSDDEFGSLGVDYGKYKETYAILKEAEALSTDCTQIKVKWSKIDECSESGANRSYSHCYGPPFLLQISGTGLVAPCGMLFNDRYKRYHMGNITQESFRSIIQSARYWEVIRELACGDFDAKKMCGSLCLQHSVNKFLNEYIKGKRKLIEPTGKQPQHKEFV